MIEKWIAIIRKKREEEKGGESKEGVCVENPAFGLFALRSVNQTKVLLPAKQ